MGNQVPVISESARSKAEEFLKISHDFKLGRLPTECQSIDSMGLSSLSKDNLKRAVQIVLEMDLNVLKILKTKVKEVENMFKSILNVVLTGKRVFIAGCGATGRLSLLAETVWRQEISRNKSAVPELEKLSERVVGLMAGGDIALIKSVEDFEDHPEFAKQQLIDLGFDVGDLLIASTEGGETPWVIGATEHAAELQSTQPLEHRHLPYYLYCNPDDVLKQTVLRSKKVLENDLITKINMFVGPMTITGSTRMQSSTILMFAICLALFATLKAMDSTINFDFPSFFNEKISNVEKLLLNVDLPNLIEDLIFSESRIYNNDELILYETNEVLALGVLTDTTERSPTFSLRPFENQHDAIKVPSKCHLILPMAGKNIKDGWRLLLGGREPRCLDGGYWEKYKEKVSIERLLGHDFSLMLIDHRKTYSDKKQNIFKIYNDQNNKKIYFDLISENKDKLISKSADLSILGDCLIGLNVFLKLVLNTLSTLVMGRLSRYESNIMTFVRPTNYKLIDRSIRYIIYLLREKYNNKEAVELTDVYKQQAHYDFVCSCLFHEIENLKEDEAIVLKVTEFISKNFEASLLCSKSND